MNVRNAIRGIILGFWLMGVGAVLAKDPVWFFPFDSKAGAQTYAARGGAPSLGLSVVDEDPFCGQGCMRLEVDYAGHESLSVSQITLTLPRIRGHSVGFYLRIPSLGEANPAFRLVLLDAAHKSHLFDWTVLSDGAVEEWKYVTIDLASKEARVGPILLATLQFKDFEEGWSGSVFLDEFYVY